MEGTVGAASAKGAAAAPGGRRGAPAAPVRRRWWPGHGGPFSRRGPAV